MCCVHARQLTERKGTTKITKQNTKAQIFFGFPTCYLLCVFCVLLGDFCGEKGFLYVASWKITPKQ